MPEEHRPISTSIQTVTPVATPAGLGADHPNALLTAFVGGIMQTLSFATANPGNATPVASSGTPYIVQGARAGLPRRSLIEDRRLILCFRRFGADAATDERDFQLRLGRPR